MNGADVALLYFRAGATKLEASSGFAFRLVGLQVLRQVLDSHVLQVKQMLQFAHFHLQNLQPHTYQKNMLSNWLSKKKRKKKENLVQEKRFAVALCLPADVVADKELLKKKLHPLNQILTHSAVLTEFMTHM